MSYKIIVNKEKIKYLLNLYLKNGKLNCYIIITYLYIDINITL